MSNLLYLPLLMVVSLPILVNCIKKPFIIVLILTLTMWLSPLSGAISVLILTPNRVLGLIGLGIIIGNKALGIDAQKNLKFSPFDYAFWIYILTISIGFVIHQPSETTKNLIGDMLAGYVLYWIALNTIRTTKILGVILWIIILSSDILSISIVVEAIKNINLNIIRFGGMLQVNAASSQIAAALPMIMIFLLKSDVSKPIKLYLVLNIPLFILVIFLTGSRSGLLLLTFTLLAVLLWFVKRPKGSIILTITLFISGVFLGYSILINFFPHLLDRGLYNITPVIVSGSESRLSQNPDIRIQLQQLSWQTFLSNPLAGVGLGNYQEIPRQNFWLAVGDRDHNFFTLTLAETGISGFLAVGFIFFAVYMNLVKTYRSSSSTSNKAYIFFITTSFSIYCLIDQTLHGTLGLGNKAWFIVAAISVLAANLYYEPSETSLETSLTKVSRFRKPN